MQEGENLFKPAQGSQKGPSYQELTVEEGAPGFGWQKIFKGEERWGKQFYKKIQKCGINRNIIGKTFFLNIHPPPLKKIPPETQPPPATQTLTEFFVNSETADKNFGKGLFSGKYYPAIDGDNQKYFLDDPEANVENFEPLTGEEENGFPLYSLAGASDADDGVDDDAADDGVDDDAADDGDDDDVDDDYVDDAADDDVEEQKGQDPVDDKVKTLNNWREKLIEKTNKAITTLEQIEANKQKAKEARASDVEKAFSNTSTRM